MSLKERFLKKSQKAKQVLAFIGSHLIEVFFTLLLIFLIGLLSTFLLGSANNYFGNYPSREKIADLISEDEQLAQYEFVPDDVLDSGQRCYQVSFGNECMQDFLIVTDDIRIEGIYVWGTLRANPTYSLQIEYLE